MSVGSVGVRIGHPASLLLPRHPGPQDRQAASRHRGFAPADSPSGPAPARTRRRGSRGHNADERRRECVRMHVGRRGRRPRARRPGRLRHRRRQGVARGRGHADRDAGGAARRGTRRAPGRRAGRPPSHPRRRSVGGQRQGRLVRSRRPRPGETSRSRRGAPKGQHPRNLSGATDRSGEATLEHRTGDATEGEPSPRAVEEPRMPDPSASTDPSRMLPFAGRHVGPRDDEISRMLETVGHLTLEALVSAAVPAGIRTHDALDLPAAATELAALEELRGMARRNQRQVQMIGLGYYDTVTPPVVVRRVLESPAWYTAYTPYQPEISQGRLKALLNFQTMVADLTGLPTANASLLDEATAAAEAMTLMRRSARGGADRLVVDADCLPQTIAVVRTRAEPMGITVEVADLTDSLPDGEFFGVLLQYPGASGQVRDLQPAIEAAHERGASAAVAADLLALTLLTPPGELGADVAVGTTQRFGVPLGYGGPHAGYIP